MTNPKFKFKNLTRTDLLQYHGENFVNVPVYTIRNEISSSSQPTTSHTRSDVQWGRSTDVFWY